MNAARRRFMDALFSPAAARAVGEPFFRVCGFRKKTGEIIPAQVQRILVVRLDQIGDVVLTSPFLRELRRAFLNTWITLVVKPATLNLVEKCPYVNEVLTYDWNTTGSLGRLRRHARAIELAWNHLWGRRFDLAILPRWGADYYHASFLVYFSGAAWRLGYSEAISEHKSEINIGYDHLFTNTLRDHAVKHQVEHNLEVLRYLGATVSNSTLELWLDEDDEAFADRTLLSRGVHPENHLIAFGIGASHPSKTWPLANFIALGRLLERDLHPRILVVAGPEQTSQGEQLQRELGDMVVNVAGQTTLRQTAALLKRCHLFIGNDSGPMHLAAAAGVGVVEISCHAATGDQSHTNSPSRFHPWTKEYLVLQPAEPTEPCGSSCEQPDAHCILVVSVDNVKKAASTLIERLASANPPRTGTC
jgi:ADP-heptose:LPS heptosyltransferase